MEMSAQFQNSTAQRAAAAAYQQKGNTASVNLVRVNLVSGSGDRLKAAAAATTHITSVPPVN
jgi:hypothetical protein